MLRDVGKRGREEPEGGTTKWHEETFGVVVHCLDGGNGFTGAYTCQNLLSIVHFTCSLLYVKYMSRKLLREKRHREIKQLGQGVTTKCHDVDIPYLTTHYYSILCCL